MTRPLVLPSLIRGHLEATRRPLGGCFKALFERYNQQPPFANPTRPLPTPSHPIRGQQQLTNKPSAKSDGADAGAESAAWRTPRNPCACSVPSPPPPRPHVSIQSDSEGTVVSTTSEACSPIGAAAVRRVQNVYLHMSPSVGEAEAACRRIRLLVAMCCPVTLCLPLAIGCGWPELANACTVQSLGEDAEGPRSSRPSPATAHLRFSTNDHPSQLEARLPPACLPSCHIRRRPE